MADTSESQAGQRIRPRIRADEAGSAYGQTHRVQARGGTRAHGHARARYKEGPAHRKKVLTFLLFCVLLVSVVGYRLIFYGVYRWSF